MEGYLKGTHRKLLKIREKYTLMKTAKEIAPFLHGEQRQVVSP